MSDQTPETPFGSSQEDGQTGLAIIYALLGVILTYRWEDNPKLHQRERIHDSVKKYGFNDPIGVDHEHKFVCEGHGRLEFLQDLKTRLEAGDPSAFLPKNVRIAPDGDWLIPTVNIGLENREQAMLYALVHNRAGVSKYSPEDYDNTRIARIRRKAAEAGQLSMLEAAGFGDDDMIASGVGAFQLPELPSFDQQGGTGLPAANFFDAASLPDAPGYQADQAQQSLMIMVTFPTFDDMKKGLRALSIGRRATLPNGAKYAAMDGMEFLDRWVAALLQGQDISPRTPTAPVGVLPGQLMLDGESVVEDPDNLPQPWDLQAQEDEPEEVEEPGEVEPAWIGDLCPHKPCGGSGFTGYRTMGGLKEKIMCPVCGGAGDKAKWHAMREQAVQA